jgi:Tetratricopeptide repeat/Heterokaryon incompatibility protein (HET)
VQFEPGDTEKRIYDGGGSWYFWIDAICINQESPIERNHQVRLMTDIYRGAETVVVSLGPECDDMFYHLAQGREPDLVSFWESEYWTRLWTAQEFVLARDVVFTSISCALSIDSINNLLGKSYPVWRLPALEIRRKSIKEGKLVLGGTRQGATLSNVLWLFRRQKCSEIRDTVYAVLALVDWELEAARSGLEALEADYTISAGELWNKLQKYGITWVELSSDFHSAVDKTFGRRSLTSHDARHLSKMTIKNADILTERAPWADENTSAELLVEPQGKSPTSKRDAISPYKLRWEERFYTYLLENGMGSLVSINRDLRQWREAMEVSILDHPETLSIIANMASLYINQGRWKEAEDLDAQVVETRKRVLGAEHPDTLTSIANLASTLWSQGRWKEAEDLDVQVMEARKRVLGAEHPSTLTSVANLASMYRNQGRWKEAKDLDMQVMETSLRVLGPKHPSTLTSMANLASTYRNQG